MSIHQLVGQTLGQYEMRELLSLGGMGAVYRGYQTSLKRAVAIKVLSPVLAQEPGYIERFNREAETAAALEHRHIIPIHDYGIERGISYVVMRLLTGGSLSDRMAQHRSFYPSLGEIAELLKQVGSALDYAHDRGVIHRDIKPNNIMFDDQGSAYIVDFGIAKLVAATTTITEAGAVMGTPAYMSPEQWRAEPLTSTADQYALGVIAYALVVGHPPFEAPTPYAMMLKHLHELPTPPHTERPDIPEAISGVLARALAKSPSARFPNSMAFAQAFERAVSGLQSETTAFFTAPVLRSSIAETPARTQEHSTRSRGRKTLLWALGVLVVILLLAGIWLVAPWDNDNKTSAAPTHTADLDQTVAAAITATMANLAALPSPTASPTLSPSMTAVEIGPVTDEPSALTVLVPDLDGMVLEVTQYGSPLNARAAPSLDAEVLTRLYWGDRVLWQEVRTDGWLEVRLSDGRQAYISEDTRFTTPRDPAQITPGIEVGATIRITAEGDGMHLVEQVNTLASDIDLLEEGQTLTVIGGPEYAEYYIWWQLELPDGRTGWAVDIPGWMQVSP